ncbi:A disintegrin and metalloproteinase with thrombospondin motifs 20 [Bulinus truncatus]|nr:A disintegrin and metalloproteinase with thrombospondin motifs 20 [Bulinus truncatus]
MGRSKECLDYDYGTVLLQRGKNLLGKGIAGTANIGKTCYGDGASVIPHSTRRDLILTIAPHELGHSLGAQHDEDTNGICSDSDEFVMTKSAVNIPPVEHPTNPWTFSNCSIKMIKSYLSRVKCTLPENTQAKNEFPTLKPGQRAGEVLSKDEQCQLIFNDKNSRYCPVNSTVVDAVLCSRMRCCKLTSNNTCGETCPSFRPLDYTKCDVNKACLRALCVAI